MCEPWPWPVAPREPKSSARTRATRGISPSSRSPSTKRTAARIGPTVWGSDGDKHRFITQRDAWTQLRDDRDLRWPAIIMEGPSVFRWAVWSMAKEAQRALDAAGVRADELAAFIPHQANVRIIDQMAKTLGLPPDLPIARDIVTTANTSAASVPLAMERMLREGEVEPGGLALQIGFGAGLVWAAQVVTLP